MRALAAAVILIAAIETPSAGQVHESPRAGTWYPADRSGLVKLLDQSYGLAAKRTGAAPPRKHLRALVVPHAGLQYSGVVAASAYRLLDRPANIILLAFSHRALVPGVVAPAVDVFRTPLGDVRVNGELREELRFPRLPEEALCDHSLENQLPFLQRFAPEATLVPLYVGLLDKRALEAAARKLSARLAKGDILIASSDFTHYGKSYQYTPFPNDADISRKLLGRAVETFERIGTLEVGEFDRFLKDTGDTLCGRDPIRLLMATLAALKENVYLHAADYQASGDITKDYSHSVGYGALAFYPASAYAVEPEDQQKLLASSRKTLELYLAGAADKRAPVPPSERTPDLQQRTGAFITIHKKGQLRGCVGDLMPRAPVWDTVVDRTLAASSADSRFPPLRKEDGPVTLEISLLTPLKKLKDWRSYRLGLGGVIVVGNKSGVLLPQIARENRWDATQFLENLARKAGLDPEAYRDSRASIYVYEAQVFGESRPGAADGKHH